jgi:hypothetical protein
MANENDDLLQKLAEAERTIGQWAIRVGNAECEAANAAKRERAVRGELETARAAFVEADRNWRAAEQRAASAEDVVATLVRLFRWSDSSVLHAALHVENAVHNLRADASTARHFAAAAHAEGEAAGRAAERAAVVTYLRDHPDVADRRGGQQVDAGPNPAVSRFVLREAIPDIMNGVHCREEK